MQRLFLNRQNKFSNVTQRACSHYYGRVLNGPSLASFSFFSNNFKRIKTVEVSGMGFELASSEEVASMLIHRHLNKQTTHWPQLAGWPLYRGHGTACGGKSRHLPCIQRQSLFYGGWQHNYWCQQRRVGRANEWSTYVDVYAIQCDQKNCQMSIKIVQK